MITKPIIKSYAKIDYHLCWQQMRQFTETRTLDTRDELWLVEHDPVFTLGLAAKEEHLLHKNHNIPVVRTDRGGQVTYHGPGQIIIYLLIDLKRLHLSIRDLVTKIELGIITYLASLGVIAYGNRNAPGVYVAGQKIAALGLKIRKGCSYHGLSFNLAMDTRPFSYINPCGYAGLQVVNLLDLVAELQPQSLTLISHNLARSLITTIYAGAN